MTTEEKARAYDEAFKKAKKLYEQGTITESLNYVFPELQDDEDERIRIELIKEINGLWGNDSATWPSSLEKKNKYIAWLEKQGKQKPAENKGMNLVEEGMTPFQKKVFCIIDTTIEEEQGLKQVCDELLRLAHDEIIYNPAWSEEDERNLEFVIRQLRIITDEKHFAPVIDWLKSFKDRYTWKPSDEQMDALQYVYRNLNPPLSDKLGWNSLKHWN